MADTNKINVEKSKRPPRRRGRKGNKTVGNDFPQIEENEVEANTQAKYRPHKTLLIQMTEDIPTWHECGRNSKNRDDTIFSVHATSKSTGSNEKMSTNPHQLVSKYRDLADSIFKQEVIIFRHHSSDSSDKDEKWVENTMRKGTLKDRIAAMSVVLSSHPVHKFYALDMLFNLVGVSYGGSNNANPTNQRVGQMASEALTDLFSNTLIPPHRKLVGLEARPLFLFDDFQDNGQVKRHISPRTLLLWRYEDILKSKYNAFLTQYLAKTLSQNSTSSLDLTKSVALRTACSLLKEIPEGEQILLSMVVNKIGDPSKKIAAAAAHELRGILDMHPNMMNTIAREVQQLAYRPHLSSRALYNCITFLNQLKLIKKEESSNLASIDDQKKGQPDESFSLPASLVNTYFQLFEVAVNKGHSSSKKKRRDTAAAAMKSRLLGALLTGVNRAHPYLPSKDIGMEQHIDALYKISHISPPSVRTQALMLLFHLAVGSGGEPSRSENITEYEASRKDRFYRALYSKVGDPIMLLAGRQLTLFFNLIYKAMKNDTNDARVIAFGKRLLHVTFHSTPATISGALFLISEVVKHQPSLHASVFSTSGHMATFCPLKREPSAAFTPVGKFADKTDADELEKLDDAVSTNIASIWELALTLHHYHPTVSKFSSSLTDIKYNGDPLRDFTLAPFLDKFAFRNPKALKKTSKKSIGARRSGLEAGKLSIASLPMNDPSVWKKEEKQASEREDFFKKFFAERARRDVLKGIDRGENVSEDTDALENAENNAENKEMDLDWDTDEEEEEFVQNLAEKLIENSAGEMVNFDDEDPDMGGWVDVEDSDSYVDDDDDDDSATESREVQFAAFDGIASGGTSGTDEDSTGGDSISEKNSEDDEMALQFVGSDNSESDEKDNISPENLADKMTNQSAFADASEYDEIIAKALSEKSGIKRALASDDTEVSQEVSQKVSSNKGRRRKSTIIAKALSEKSGIKRALASDDTEVSQEVSRKVSSNKGRRRKSTTKRKKAKTA